MPDDSTTNPPTGYARIAGLAYLAIFALAIFANFTIFIPMVESGDPAATAANILAGEAKYRLGIACFIAVLIADVIVGWALFIVLQRVDANLSLLTMLFRMTYTIAHVGVVLYLVNALEIASAPEAVAAAYAGLQGVLVYHFADAHNVGFTVTLIFFGVHLLLLGFMIVRAPYLPSLIGLLVMIAGAGYMIDGFGPLLYGGYAEIPNISMYTVVFPALIGEGALMLWLLIFGINAKRWRESGA